MSSEGRLEGKVALVTGAASGIGLAGARRFAQEGAKIVAVDLETSGVEQVAHELGGVALAGDVGRERTWDLILEAVVGAGGLDVAFLNAGTATGQPDISALSEEQYRRIMGVNVDQMFYGVRALAPVMARSGGGAIIMTASLAGLVSFSADPIYTMTKHAVVGLVRALGPRLAEQKIVVNAICPGMVDTPLIDGEVRDALAGSGFPLLSPEEVAEAALLCAVGEWSGKAVVVQVGREPTPYRFARPPGPRDPDVMGKIPPGWLGDPG